MKRKLFYFVLAALAAGVACRPTPAGTPLGTTYAQITRPVVWRVLPRTQAESLGIQPGDLVLSYNSVPVSSVDDLLRLLLVAAAAPGRVPMTVLRGEEELKLSAAPGPLGILPDVLRYSSGLAVAVKDLLGHYGVTADYDWLAALTGESFAFTANPDVCRAGWPGGLAGEYTDGVEEMFGLRLKAVFVNEGEDSLDTAEAVRREALTVIRDRLTRGKPVLVLGEWLAESDDETWGIAVRYGGTDSTVYGYTVGAAGEVPLNGMIGEAYEVGFRQVAEPDPAELMTTVLTQALELGQAYSDSGWQSGIAAYDVWVNALDTVPFCPVCGESSQSCFDQLVWSLLASKESANRFLADMREALPDLAGPIDEAVADNSAVIGKLTGIIQSGVRVGTVAGQEKLARVVVEIQALEVDLLGIYEDIIGGM
jgi:hypothetical protein